MSKYKATQIYLEPQQHVALKEKARQRGVSMAEFLRGLVADSLEEQNQGVDLSAITGIVESGEPTDIGRDKRKMVRESVLRRHGFC